LELEQRLIAAVSNAAKNRTAYVCYSGGIDSTLVLASCVRAGLPTVALLGVSASLATSEREDAHRIAREIGATVEEIETNEIESSGYRANAGDRCYYCKTSLYEKVHEIAATRVDSEVVFVGTHLDDLGEHRLHQIEQVEEFLRAHDVWPARARWHESVVRIEVPPTLFEKVVTDPLREDLRRACRKAGFKFVALDLGGLQSGSLSLPLAST